MTAKYDGQEWQRAAVIASIHLSQLKSHIAQNKWLPQTQLLRAQSANFYSSALILSDSLHVATVNEIQTNEKSVSRLYCRCHRRRCCRCVYQAQLYIANRHPWLSDATPAQADSKRSHRKNMISFSGVFERFNFGNIQIFLTIACRLSSVPFVNFVI